MFAENCVRAEKIGNNSLHRKQITRLPLRTALTFVEDDRANYLGLTTVHLINTGEHIKLFWPCAMKYFSVVWRKKKRGNTFS